jgi:5-methylthioribose kinase
MDLIALTDYLRKAGLLRCRQATVNPLAGGVSSDVLLVESGKDRFVVKQALEQLRVRDEWHCDTARNITEHEAICYAGRFFPESVPTIFYFDRDNRLFAMEYLGNEYVPWKQQLLQGMIDQHVAERVAGLLAKLHSESWQSSDAKSQFAKGIDFYALRIDPYLLTTAERHPDLRKLFQEEAARLQQTAIALVHGDWSAKNILVAPDRIVILDWEVAWFGDPAFDSAFFLNLLYLKSLFNRQKTSEYLQLMHVFRTTYRNSMKFFDEDLSRRIVRLTLMLMLARIDGKSPVEYITSNKDKDLVRTFVRRSLFDGVDETKELDNRWQSALGAT